MIKIALCDDESAWLEKSKEMLMRYGEAHPDQPFQLTCFSSGKSLLSAVLMHGCFDIYILDVVMPEMTGIDTGIKLRKYDEIGKIIYLTSSPDFGVDSYIAGAFYYLLKPVPSEKMFEVLGKAITEISRRKEKCIKVKTSEDTTLIPFDNIIYVELKRKALSYCLADGRVVESVSQRDSFANCVSLLLSDNRFSLCGVSTCVNLFFISSVEKDGVMLKNGTKLFLPKKACTSLRTAWLDFWFHEEG